MTDAFARALAFTLKWEGGQVNDPLDPGGRTAYGITQRTYNAYRDSKRLPQADVFKILPEERDAIYRQRYWDVLPDIEPDNLKIAVFDAGVNSGVGTALKWLRELGWAATPVTAGQYLDRRALFYDRLIQQKPELKRFERGWKRRVDDLRAYLA